MSTLHDQMAGLAEVYEAIVDGDSERIEKMHSAGQLGSHVPLVALWRAIEESNSESIEVLVRLGQLDLNEQGEGMTALGYAIENGSPEVVKTLCELGADSNLPTRLDSRWRPLQVAVGVESADPLEDPDVGYDTGFIEVLLGKGADPLLEDALGVNALDEARQLQHSNALEMMAAVASSRPPLTGEVGKKNVTGEAIAPRTSIVVTIVSSEPSEDGSAMAVSLDDSGKVILRPFESTNEEEWFLLPNISCGSESVGYSLVNKATGLSLEQPMPFEEFLVGEAPMLKVVDSKSSIGDRQFLWRLKPVNGDNQEQLWAIQDHRHAYTIGVSRGRIADGSPLCAWAWTGGPHQKWRIHERSEATAKPVSLPKKRPGLLRRLWR